MWEAVSVCYCIHYWVFKMHSFFRNSLQRCIHLLVASENNNTCKTRFTILWAMPTCRMITFLRLLEGFTFIKKNENLELRTEIKTDWQLLDLCLMALLWSCVRSISHSVCYTSRVICMKELLSIVKKSTAKVSSSCYLNNISQNVQPNSN